jgi:hypothetical protein
MITMAKVSYTTATLAPELDTTPKELRKFLRSDLSGIESVGKGGRYTLEFTATQLGQLKKKYAKFVAEVEAKREAAKTEGPTEADEVAALAIIDGEVDTTDWPQEARDAYEAEGPTDADLEEIELDEV